MDEKPTTLTGTCHCGAIRGTLHATKPAAELQVRSCQCSLLHAARRHDGVRSGGQGHLRDRAGGAGEIPVRHAHGDEPHLRRCGMYAGVILEDGGKTWSVLNVRGLAIPEFAGRVARAGGVRRRDAAGAHRPPQVQVDADGDRVAGVRSLAVTFERNRFAVRRLGQVKRRPNTATEPPVCWSSLTLDPTYANEQEHAHRNPDARAVAHHGGGQARQVARQGRPDHQGRRHHRRDRDRQGHHGGGSRPTRAGSAGS